jgi:AcrR family transcriptional regulator
MSVKRPSVDLATPGADADDPPVPTPRARNPQGQGGRLRAELIAAADRLLAGTGDIEGLSLRAVARAVGIATPSIYLHFPDKQALIHAALVARFEELGEAVRTAVAAAPGGPVDRLRAGCLAYCRFAIEHPSAYRVLFSRAPAIASDVEPPARGIDAGEPNLRMLSEGIGACMRAGAAPIGDPGRAAIGVWTALHGIVSLRGSSPYFPWPPLEEQVDEVLTGLLRLHHKPPHFESEPAPEGYTSVER